MAKLKRQHLRNMKYTVYHLEVIGFNPVESNLGCVVLLSKLLNKKYIFSAMEQV